MERRDYLIRKLGYALLTLAVIFVFNFLLFRILPGDPAKLLVRDPRLGRQAQERIRRKFGLDKPIWFNIEGSTAEVFVPMLDLVAEPIAGSKIVGQAAQSEHLEYHQRSDDGQWVSVFQIDAAGQTTAQGWVPASAVKVHVNPFDSQFFAYLSNLFKGDMGISFSSRRDVSELLAERIWRTVVLLMGGEVLALILGCVLGLLAAWRRGTHLDAGILTGGLISWALPTFWLGLILLILARGHLPIGGMVTAGFHPANALEYWLDVGKHLVLPTLTMAIVYLGEYMLIMRSSVLEIFAEDYILVAKAKGLSTFQIIKDHALKNAALPLVTIIALTLGYTVGGAIQVETVFSWPGIGRLIYDSVTKRDYPVLQGAFLLLAVSVILANLAADILYSVLDPRVKPD
jgi:peptide/nickel transport system permease protein